jgi:hypothetical protein
MTQNHGAPGIDKIQVFISILIFQPGALGTPDKERISANLAKSTNRRINATRNGLLCPGKQGLAAGSLHRGRMKMIEAAKKAKASGA